MKKLIALLLTIPFVLISACNSVRMESFSNDEYSFQYPSTYSVEEAGEDPVLIVRGDNSRVEIFQEADFDGMRIHGFSSSGLDEYEDQLVPKEKLKTGEYSLWLFYAADDPMAQSECLAIYESFELK